MFTLELFDKALQVGYRSQVRQLVRVCRRFGEACWHGCGDGLEETKKGFVGWYFACVAERKKLETYDELLSSQCQQEFRYDNTITLTLNHHLHQPAPIPFLITKQHHDQLLEEWHGIPHAASIITDQCIVSTWCIGEERGNEDLQEGATGVAYADDWYQCGSVLFVVTERQKRQYNCIK